MKKFAVMIALFMAVTVSYGYALRWDVRLQDADDVSYAILVAVNGDNYFLSGPYEVSNGRIDGGSVLTYLEDGMESYNANLNASTVTPAAYTGNLMGNVLSSESDFSSYSFHVLLVDNAGNHLMSTENFNVGVDSKTWTQLASGGFIDTGKLWAITPEPSCALLFGLGTVLMVLRRRRRA